MSARTLVVGEALVDIVRRPDGTVEEHVGGSPLNVAVGLARLGHPVDLSTQIGADERGARIQEHLVADDVRLVPGSDRAEVTSTATAELDETGAASYTFDLTAAVPPLGGAEGHLHTGSIGALLGEAGTAVLTSMDAARGTVSYDPNARPALMGDPATALPQVRRRVALSDVVKASDEDIAWLLGRGDETLTDDEIVAVLHDWAALGAALVVATLGPRGALAVHRGEVLHVEGRQVEVADTVGAGDSFASGLISALLDAELLGPAEVRSRLAEADPAVVRSAVERGVTASAITVSRAGAQPPTRAEVTSDLPTR